MNKSKKCSVCGLNVTKNYYAFPKLHEMCTFSSLNGFVHISCLRSHPQKKEIQNELTKICLKAFKNDSDFPIVAQKGNILIKCHSYGEALEIYNFEDFVDFYIPYRQIEEVINLELGQQLTLGANGWITLSSDKKGKLKLIYYSIREEDAQIIDLPSLDLDLLKKLVTEASEKKIVHPPFFRKN